MKLVPSASLIFTMVLPLTCVNGNHHENITSTIMAVDFNPRPCMPANNNNGYNFFMRKHILGAQFDTNNKQLWSRYLYSRRLCGRVPLQSFLQKTDEMAVQSICRGSGVNLQQNLCISRRPFLVYAVWSQKLPRKGCRIRRLQRSQHPVVVACDAVANQCLPVHYEGYRGQVPGNNAQVCR
ncbi:hypothetical protein AALO_G00301010 [Alosa alosa]|uniref:Uncharacterized protein n=1 Tax=Alosa alosa TaxID=278164 RepID=A0AAV6FHQ5_9TELE|nr:hypothetical protein AALO_G00301010 [Alosa alosa]